MPLKDKASELWKKFGRYVYIGIGVLVLIAGAVYLGKWYATGKAKEFSQSIHDRWMLDHGKQLYESIAVNKNKIEELDQNYKTQSTRVNKLWKERKGVIDNAIKSGDTTAIAGLFDNLVDGYTPSK